MKKNFLFVEAIASTVYVTALIASLMLDDGVIFALSMLFLLGVWQYFGSFIWVVLGDRRRRTHFIAATIVLIFFGLMAYESIPLRKKELEVCLYVLMAASCMLGIWYIIIGYKHYQSELEQAKAQQYEAEENTALL